MQYKSSDAWLLLAIDYATGVFNKKCTLKDVIAYGDAINHAIFNIDELNDSCTKLIHIGYINYQHKMFSLTKYFRQDKKKYCKKRKNALDTWNDLEKLLKDKYSTQNNIPVSNLITAQELDASYNAYVSMLNNDYKNSI